MQIFMVSKPLKFIVLGFCLFVLIACGQVNNAVDGSETGFSKAPVKITKITGEKINFEMEVADTPQKRERGLMFRESLDDDKGMIFLFDKPQPAAFWMKNTLIPLDMLFVKQDGTIIYIHKMAQPHDETPISSEIPVKALIEVRGGLTQKLGIHIGDMVEFKGL